MRPSRVPKKVVKKATSDSYPSDIVPKKVVKKATSDSYPSDIKIKIFNGWDV